MVEAVENRKLYQVTGTSPYKKAFTLEQMIDVGNEPNPFFKFYETILGIRSRTARPAGRITSMRSSGCTR